jgi:XTP/dITP diphosphohydrolase
MSTILIASHNQGKYKEIQSLLADLEINLILPKHIGLNEKVIENGQTYLENASKKAEVFATASGLITLADDTGLEVDALNGNPGLYSARFAPQPGATDGDRRRYLLEKLHPHPRPWTAQFRCHVALISPKGDREFSEGICSGEVIPEERGNYGFGYDSIFMVNSMGCTMAELTMDEKNRLSHRALAIQAIRPKILAFLSLD